MPTPPRSSYVLPCRRPTRSARPRRAQGWRCSGSAAERRGRTWRPCCARCSRRATSVRPRSPSVGSLPVICSQSPTRSPRCWTLRSPSRTAARGCSPSLVARTKLTPPGSRRSWAGRYPSATRGSSPSAASSESCTAATTRCSSSPIPDGQDAFSMPRVAIAVRAGDEVLGSIWAAVPGPLSEERTEALCEAAKLVALHLLRVRAGADVQRRLRADLLSSALEGGAGPARPWSRLGLAGQRLMVLGVALAGTPRRLDGCGRRARERAPAAQRRVRDAPERDPPGFGSSPGQRRHLRARAGGRAGADGEERALRIAHDFLDRVGDRMRPVVGIGPVAADLAGLASRARLHRPGSPRAARGPRRAPGGPAGRYPRRGAGARAPRPGRRPRRPADRLAGAADRVRPSAPRATWSRPFKPGWTPSAT